MDVGDSVFDVRRCTWQCGRFWPMDGEHRTSVRWFAGDWRDVPALTAKSVVYAISLLNLLVNYVMSGRDIDISH